MLSCCALSLPPRLPCTACDGDDNDDDEEEDDDDDGMVARAAASIAARDCGDRGRDGRCDDAADDEDGDGDDVGGSAAPVCRWEGAAPVVVVVVAAS